MSSPRHESPTHGRTWWLLGPASLWLAFFFFVPLGLLAVVSFAAAGSPVEWRWDGSAYLRLLDPLLWPVFTRSLGLACLATMGCLFLGFPLAFFLVRQPPGRRYFLYFLVLVPLAANSLVLLYAWITLLRPAGVMDQFLQFVGLVGPEGFSFLYTPGAIVIGLCYWYLPFMVYPLYANLERFDFRQLEAAVDLGAGLWVCLRRILLPQCIPGLATGSLLVFVQTFCSFVVPDLLGGSRRLMAGNLIQRRFLSLPQDWPLGSALALLTILVLGLFIWWVLRRQRGGVA